MAKHQRKVEAALAVRRAAAPNGSGFRTPGSRNRRKGYRRSPRRS